MIPTGYEPQRRMVGDNGIWTCRARRADKKLGGLRQMDKWTNNKRRQSANMQKKPWRNVTCTKWWKRDSTTWRSRTEEVDDLEKRSTADDSAAYKTSTEEDIERQYDGSRPSPIGLVASAGWALR